MYSLVLRTRAAWDFGGAEGKMIANEELDLYTQKIPFCTKPCQIKATMTLRVEAFTSDLSMSQM